MKLFHSSTFDDVVLLVQEQELRHELVEERGGTESEEEEVGSESDSDLDGVEILEGGAGSVGAVGAGAAVPGGGAGAGAGGGGDGVGGGTGANENGGVCVQVQLEVVNWGAGTSSSLAEFSCGMGAWCLSNHGGSYPLASHHRCSCCKAIHNLCNQAVEFEEGAFRLRMC